MDATTSDSITSGGQQAGPGFNPLSMAQEAYQASTDFFDASIRKQIEAAMRQFQGVHPAGSKYHSEAYKGRSKLFRPKTRATIRKNEAVGAEALFATTDRVVVAAEDDGNDMQRAAADLMKRLVDYRLEKSIPWFLLSMGSYQEAQSVGVVASYQFWEYDEEAGVDRPQVELLPPENLRIDAGASWLDPINTSPYVIRLIPMYVKDVKGRMREADPRTGQAKWKTLDDSQILAAMSTGGDTTRQVRERGRTDSKEQSHAVRDFSIVWVHQNVVKIGKKDMVWYTLGTHALLSDPVPIAELWWHGKRPFVMGIAVIEAHKIYADGVGGLTKDVQAEINEVANQRIDNVKFAMNKRYFVQRNKQVDLRSLTKNMPGSVTLMNDIEKDVKVVETRDVTASAYQEQDRLNLDFDEVAGAFSPASVQSNRKLNETVGGMKLLDANTNQVGAYQLRTWTETWAEPVLRQIALLEAYYETDEVILKIAGARAKLTEKYNIREITDELMKQDVSLRIDIGFGPTSPQDMVKNFLAAMRELRELLADGILTAHGLNVGEVIKELFGKLGYRDGSRFFGDEDPGLAAAKAMIQDLQQQLEQKVSPQLVEAQVRKLDAEIENLASKNWDVRMSAMEKAVRALFASHQTAQMLATVPAMAPAADAIADAAAVMSGNEPTAGPITPTPAAPLPGFTQDEVVDPRTGVKFTPGAMPADTTPSTPANPAIPPSAGQPDAPGAPNPASPGTGAAGGIETMRSDS